MWYILIIIKNNEREKMFYLNKSKLNEKGFKLLNYINNQAEFYAKNLLEEDEKDKFEAAVFSLGANIEDFLPRSIRGIFYTQEELEFNLKQIR